MLSQFQLRKFLNSPPPPGLPALSSLDTHPTPLQSPTTAHCLSQTNSDNVLPSGSWYLVDVVLLANDGEREEGGIGRSHPLG